MIQVEKVASKLKLLPGLMNCIIESMGLLVQEAISGFQDKANGNMDTSSFYTLLETLIDTNHHLLNACSVGHPSLESIRSVLSRFGIKSKLTGAGGGGCTLALIRPSKL
jgi:mevalonate kinase